MDLIYATHEREDIGILKDYDFDLAYGVDENDFALKLSLDAHCCEGGYIVYMVETRNGTEEPTEYGGIIDAIQVDTANRTVTYTGRTWHGILSGKVIVPDGDYLVVTGDAHDIMRGLLEAVGLSDLFGVDGPSEISIPEYQFNRYTDLYSGLCKMLAENGGKLQARYQDKKVMLSAVWLVDYSQDDEWDSSQVDFSVRKAENTCNHLVCLGQGDLRNRYVIHLFTDANGGIQPYAWVDNPIKDGDYILDTRNQLLSGADEIAETFDYSSAEFTENYELMIEQPGDWGKNFSSYFLMDSDGDFVEVEGEDVDTLTAVTTKPSNWDKAYTNYYTANGDSVEGVENETYTPVTKKPADWSKNWTNYYVHFWDGVQWYWNHVESVSKTRYEKQTKKPTDWSDNFGAYYKLENQYKETKNKAGKVIKRVKVGVGYVRVTKVKKGKKDVAPTWQKGKYYTGYGYQVAPSFRSGLAKYRLDKTTVAPTWESGKFYRLETMTVSPPWKSETYYQMYTDHYAELVRYGIEHLQELAESADGININLSLLGEYDVGDIVGAVEHTTDIAVWQPITKKIISIKNGESTITYKIGAAT